MSKGQTGSDATGYKRGAKGFANSKDDGQYTGSSYDKSLLKPTSGKAVGQRATVCDDELQKDY